MVNLMVSLKMGLMVSLGMNPMMSFVDFFQNENQISIYHVEIYQIEIFHTIDRQ